MLQIKIKISFINIDDIFIIYLQSGPANIMNKQNRGKINTDITKILYGINNKQLKHLKHLSFFCLSSSKSIFS